MPHAHTEDQLVVQPAIGLFAELGWQVALEKLNPALPPVAIAGAIDELTRDRSVTPPPRLLSGRVKLDDSAGIRQSGGAAQRT